MRLVETIDRKGDVGPAISILEAHRVGLAHRAVSILVWNPERTKMLVTQRAATKATWPSFWSNAVCSHPLVGETYLAAAHRRLFEELRVRVPVAPLFHMLYGPVRCPFSGAFEHELDHVFEATLDETATIEPEPAEISSVEWVDQGQLAALEQSGELTPWFGLILKRVSWTTELNGVVDSSASP